MQLGALALPEGESHHDEYFGTQQIYHHALSATLPVTRPAGAGELKLAVDVTYQGCAEIGLCYPPDHQDPDDHATTGRAAAARRQRSAQIPGPGPGLPGRGQRGRPGQRAHRLADRRRLLPVPQPHSRSRPTSPVQLGALALPEGKSQTDEYFGTQQIYDHALSATLPVARPGGAGNCNLAVDVTYQGCAHAGLCYPPITKTLAVTLPPAAAGPAERLAPAPAAPAPAASTGAFVSEQDRLAALIRNGNLLRGARSPSSGPGLLLAFTPCVLPMVPILSGIIAGHGANVTTIARLHAVSDLCAGHGLHLHRGRHRRGGRRQSCPGTVPADLDHRAVRRHCSWCWRCR